MEEEEASAADARPRKGGKRANRLYQTYPSKNTWLFFGHGLKGPDKAAFIGAFLALVIPAVLYWIWVAPFYWRRDHVWVIVIFGWLNVSALVFHLITAFTDPGIIPRRPHPGAFRLPATTSSVKVEDVDITIKYCKTCAIYRPPRATHCGVCDNCVERFDHHCPWVGNCIGKRNYRWFLLYVSFVPLNALWLVVTSIVRIATEANEEPTKTGWDAFVDAAKSTAWLAPLLAVYSLLVLCLVGGLGGFHLFLSSHAMTTNEKIKRSYRRKRNTNDHGCWHNVCWAYCGPRFPRYVKFHRPARADTWPWNRDEAPQFEMQGVDDGMAEEREDSVPVTEDGESPNEYMVAPGDVSEDGDKSAPVASKEAPEEPNADESSSAVVVIDGSKGSDNEVGDGGSDADEHAAAPDDATADSNDATSSQEAQVSAEGVIDATSGGSNSDGVAASSPTAEVKVVLTNGDDARDGNDDECEEGRQDASGDAGTHSSHVSEDVDVASGRTSASPKDASSDVNDDGHDKDDSVDHDDEATAAAGGDEGKATDDGDEGKATDDDDEGKATADGDEDKATTPLQDGKGDDVGSVSSSSSSSSSSPIPSPSTSHASSPRSTNSDDRDTDTPAETLPAEFRRNSSNL